MCFSRWMNVARTNVQLLDVGVCQGAGVRSTPLVQHKEEKMLIMRWLENFLRSFLNVGDVKTDSGTGTRLGMDEWREDYLRSIQAEAIKTATREASVKKRAERLSEPALVALYKLIYDSKEQGRILDEFGAWLIRWQCSKGRWGKVKDSYDQEKLDKARTCTGQQFVSHHWDYGLANAGVPCPPAWRLVRDELENALGYRITGAEALPVLQTMLNTEAVVAGKSPVSAT